MSTYEAVFEIDSRGDADATRRILEHAHDRIREESRGVEEPDADELLAAFERLREATRPPSPGKLTISYERYDEREFES